MFSVKEKTMIAKKIEELLLSLKHPEMPDKMPVFEIHVEGKERWSWANIKPNWTFNNSPPSVNPFNEESRDIHKRLKDE